MNKKNNNRKRSKDIREENNSQYENKNKEFFKETQNQSGIISRKTRQLYSSLKAHNQAGFC